MEVLQFVPQLGQALWSLKLMYDQHVDNMGEIEELQSFIQDYGLQIPILQMRFKKVGGNVMGMVALKNLEKDVVEATIKLERWSRDKSFFRVFTSGERMQKLGKLHSKVMACVQKNLGIVGVSMLLDVQATQATILDSHAELKSLLISSIVSIQGMLPIEVREEVVEASTSSFGDPKFWEDILAAVDNHQGGVSSSEEKNVYEDPITTNLMIDPIVASDGHTYCRWTIIDNNLTTSPFNVDEDLSIVIDNLHCRRVLFEKFPEQCQIFRERRDEYRSRAFLLKSKGLLGDAALALHHVLEWDKRDVECIEALGQVQGALEEAKEKYLEASPGPSKKLQSGGPVVSNMHEAIVEPPMDLDGACKLILDISNPILEVQHHALYGVCHWSARNAKFQKFTIEKGGVRLLASLLPTSDQITEGLTLSILLHLSFYTKRGYYLSNFQSAMDPLALVLKAGSAQACEQAARIVWNLSVRGCIPPNTPWNLRHELENPGIKGALVFSLGDHRPLQVQQIVSSALHNLLSRDEFMEGAVKAGILPILLGLMTEKRLPLEEGLPLLACMFQSLPDYSLDRTMVFYFDLGKSLKPFAPPSLWLDLALSSEASVDQGRAAVILCRLCGDCMDGKYREQAVKSLVLERFRKLVHSSTVRSKIFEIAGRNWKPDLGIMMFGEMDWWSGLFPEKEWWSPSEEEGKGESV